MRLNRFYAAWLGPCHCFILAMIRLVGLSLCHNYLKLRDDGDLKCGPSLGVQGQHLPARSVTQLTVLSRLAGPIERWPETLLPQAREVDLWPLQTAFGLVSARGVTILQSSKFWELCQSNVFNQVKVPPLWFLLKSICRASTLTWKRHGRQLWATT